MTVGRYVNTGEDFKIIDNWSQPENAHRMLAGLWVGTTTYREAADFLVEGPSISSLQRVEKVEDHLKEGQEIEVKVLGIDRGRIKLSRKALIDK